MSTQRPTITTRQSRLQKVLHGIDLHYPNVTTFMLGGQNVTKDDLKGLIQGDLDAIDASAKAKAQYREEVQVERNARAKVDPLLTLFKRRVIADFGDTSDSATTLEDFGYSPRKASKAKLATKVEAQDKAKATRQARHTQGAKQKVKIKGTVSASPPTEPSVPAPAPKA